MSNDDDSLRIVYNGEIYNYIESIGGRAVMTSDKHERASDRCTEALLKIEND